MFSGRESVSHVRELGSKCVGTAWIGSPHWPCFKVEVLPPSVPLNPGDESVRTPQGTAGQTPAPKHGVC